MTAKWGQITAGEIISPIQGKLVSGRPHLVFGGLSTDSRKITQGELFWALRGERYDGHDFIKQAIGRGAAGIVAENGRGLEISPGRNIAVIAVDDTLKALGDLARWWRHEHNVQIAAITGSVGKTTAKDMAASILELNAPTLKNEGNFNNLIGLPLTLLLLEEEHRRAVLEMGMNRHGEIARLTEIADPDVGLITKVGKAHLEGVGDIKGVVKAKMELLEKISPGSHVVLNGDDTLLMEAVMEAAARFSRKIITFGLGSKNEIRAEEIRDLGQEGITFQLRYDEHSVPIRLQVPGLQNVYNAMAASAIAISLEESPDHLAEGLYRFQGVKGRFSPIPLPGGATLIDDTYNANPISLKAAIDTVKQWVSEGGRAIVGLGEMMELGDETIPAHREAGRMVAELAPHYFMVLGDHAHEMIEGAIGGGFPPEKAMVVDTHEEMAAKIEELMKKGDIILLKGSRKMHLEKVIEQLTKNGEPVQSK